MPSVMIEFDPTSPMEVDAVTKMIMGLARISQDQVKPSEENVKPQASETQVGAEPKATRNRKPKTPPAPLEATSETAALAAEPDMEDVASMLGEDTGMPDGVTSSEVDVQTSDSSLEDLLSLSETETAKDEAAAGPNKYASWTSAQLREEFEPRVKKEGPQWFRDQMVKLGRKSIKEITDDDFRTIFTESDAKNAA